MIVRTEVEYTSEEVKQAICDAYRAKFGDPPAGFQLVAESSAYTPIPRVTVKMEQTPAAMEDSKHV